MPEQLFVASARFDALAAALADLDPEHPEYENQIRVTLGEVGGVWPDTIQAEAEADPTMTTSIAKVDAELVQIGALDVVKDAEDLAALNRIRRLLIENEMMTAKLGPMPKA